MMDEKERYQRLRDAHTKFDSAIKQLRRGGALQTVLEDFEAARDGLMRVIEDDEERFKVEMEQNQPEPPKPLY